MSIEQIKKQEHTNSSLDRKERRDMINKKEKLCPFCPVNGGENANRQSKHGKKKPRYKNKRN